MELPLRFLIAALIGSTITLLVTIVINATVANEDDNDLGHSTGWALLTPAPVVSLIWTAIDMALFLLKHYHDIYRLVTTLVLAALYSGLGAVGIGLYTWSDEGAWVAGMFLIFMAVFYWIAAVSASISLRQTRASMLRTKMGINQDTSQYQH